MSTEVVDQVSEESLAFEAPEVHVGDEIVFYEDAQVTNKPDFGKVLGISGRNIVVVVYSQHCPHGMLRKSVLHITDPWLQERADRRINGGWDFTAREKKFRKMEATLNRYGDRLVQMEMDTATKPAPKSK